MNQVVRHRAPLVAVVLATFLAAAAYGVPRAAERRPGIAEAAAALDAGHAEAALDILKRLGPGTRESALAAFYCVAAYDRSGHVAEADGALERVWARPDAEAELTAWGRSHPTLAGHAEHIAGTLLMQIPRVGESIKPARLDRIERTFRLVLQLNPSNYWAREGLAVVDENRGRYASAHDALTAVIASIGTPRSIEGRRRLTNSLMTRARVSADWAGSLPHSQEGAVSPQAESLLNEALGDLDQGDLSVVTDDLIMKFELNFIRCNTVLALADVATGGGRYPEALAYYDQAGRVLETLADHPAERESVYRALKTKVRDRLRTEPPRLQALLRKDAASQVGVRRDCAPPGAIPEERELHSR